VKTRSADEARDDRGETFPRPLDAVHREAKRATGSWWVHVLVGLTAIALGVFALVSQVNAVATLVGLVAVLLLATGALELVIGAASRPVTWLAIAAGVASIALGIVAVAWPNATLYVLALIVGVSLVAWGVYDVYKSLTDRVVRPRSVALVLGIALVAVGAVVLVHPTVSALVLGILVGVFLIIQGGFLLVIGLRLLDARRAMRRVEKHLSHDEHAGHGTSPRKIA